jgi:hypothetical protein
LTVQIEDSRDVQRQVTLYYFDAMLTRIQDIHWRLKAKSNTALKIDRSQVKNGVIPTLPAATLFK